MGRYTRLAAVLFFLSVLFAVFELSGLRQHFNLAFLRQQMLDHELGGVLIFILLFALGNLIQVPGWIFLAAAVLTLGRTTGGLVTYVAASISCTLTFFTIRIVSGDALRQLNNRTVTRILQQLDAHPIRSITVARILFQTLPALNYALAMSGVKFRKYLIGTVLGLPLPIFMYCLFFDYLEMMLNIR